MRGRTGRVKRRLGDAWETSEGRGGEGEHGEMKDR